MNRFIKVFWLFSMLGFLAILLWVYAALPLQVSLSLSSFSTPDVVVSKDAFFYMMLAVVVLSNGVILTLAKVLSLMPAEDLNNKPALIKSEAYKKDIINWLGSFSFILNLFYSIAVTFVGFMNSPDFVPFGQYRFVVYLGVLLIILWLLMLVYFYIRNTLKK